MVNKNVKILLIEDNPGDARLIREMLSEVPDVSFELETAKRLSTGLRHLAKENPDVVLLDLALPDSQGLDTLNKVYAKVKTVPIVVLTGLEDESVGIEAVQQGAQDYLVKGQIEGKVLWRVINYSIERKRAEEMLRQSEERYRTLFNSKVDGMCVIDETMKILLANQAAADIFGFASVDELLGVNPFDYIPVEEKERVLTIVGKDMFENDLRRTNEFRLKSKSGNDVWISAIGTLTEYQGKLAGLISFRDVTERKQVEEALQQSEERYRSILEEMGDAYFETDLSGNFTVINDATCHALGRPRGKIIGTNYRTFVVKEHIDAVYQAFNQVYRTGTPIRQFSYEILGKDGGKRFVEISLLPLRDRGGRIVGFRGVGRDITERKKAEQVLVDEATRRRILVEQSSDGIVVLDGNGKVYDVNQRFAEMLGYSLEEARELNVWDWEFQYPREQVKEMIRTVDEKGDHFETRHRRKDGTVYDVEISTNGAVIAGQKLVFCVCRDITERKRMESEIGSSRDRLDRIINSMVEVLMVIDTDYNIINVNRSFLEYYGGERKDIVGRKCYEVVHRLSEPCSKARHRCPLKTVLKTGKPFSGEGSYKTAEGQELIFEEAMFPLVDAAGNIEAVVEMQHDVTVRKSMEESLRLSEQNLRNSIEGSPLGIRVLDKEGKIIYANRALLDMWGYSSVEELEAVPGKQRYAPESYAKHRERVKKGRGENTPLDYEVSIVRSDGQVRHVSASTRALMWGGEKQFQSVYQDITERKQAELEYRTMIRATMDGFWLTDMQGHFLDVNDAYCRLTGYSRDELLNMSIKNVEAVEKPEDVAGRIQKVKEVGYDRFETRHRRKDGGIVDVEISVNYLSVGGGRMFVFVRDITERKRMEEELRHNVERFKKAMEGVVQVIASIVEVRDPYTAGHQRRVAELACAIAEEMGFAEERIEEIRMAALIHDIGKIYVPAEILSKPSRLTEIEFSMIKSHPQVAYDILKSVDFPWPICKLVLQHHERINSSGYPAGLSGEDILTGAKIIAVADVVEAMASHRPYRPALGLDKALEEISKNSGVLYDPEAADACLRVFNERGFKFDSG
jgi:PAS domain S-box-containing protein/putative nucleotidyltransferase with HDIG domain